MVDKLKKRGGGILHKTKLITWNRPKLITDLIQALSLMKAYNGKLRVEYLKSKSQQVNASFPINCDIIVYKIRKISQLSPFNTLNQK